MYVRKQKLYVAVLTVEDIVSTNEVGMRNGEHDSDFARDKFTFFLVISSLDDLNCSGGAGGDVGGEPDGAEAAEAKLSAEVVEVGDIAAAGASERLKPLSGGLEGVQLEAELAVGEAENY